MARPEIHDLAASLQKIASVIGPLDVGADPVPKNKLCQLAGENVGRDLAF